MSTWLAFETNSSFAQSRVNDERTGITFTVSSGASRLVLGP
jgi:hypothetical protein